MCPSLRGLDCLIGHFAEQPRLIYKVEKHLPMDRYSPALLSNLRGAKFLYISVRTCNDQTVILIKIHLVLRTTPG